VCRDQLATLGCALSHKPNTWNESKWRLVHCPVLILPCSYIYVRVVVLVVNVCFELLYPFLIWAGRHHTLVHTCVCRMCLCNIHPIGNEKLWPTNHRAKKPIRVNNSSSSSNNNSNSNNSKCHKADNDNIDSPRNQKMDNNFKPVCDVEPCYTLPVARSKLQVSLTLFACTENSLAYKFVLNLIIWTIWAHRLPHTNSDWDGVEMETESAQLTFYAVLNDNSNMGDSQTRRQTDSQRLQIAAFHKNYYVKFNWK